MKKLIKPRKLYTGDKIAFVSLSSGIAGKEDVKWRIDVAKKRLEDMGYEVIIMPNALAGPTFVYNNPELRAKDLMDAFKDDTIKAIFTTTGGNDSIRILPFIDYEVIKNNPKIFTGFSDSTITHLICHKAGINSFYGISILHDLAENIEIPKYTLNAFFKVFTDASIIGEIDNSEILLEHGLRWDETLKCTKRNELKNTVIEFLNSEETVEGNLIGGCLEVLNIARGTEVFPSIEEFKDSILFIETSGVQSPPWLIGDLFRSFGAQGILDKINGLIVGRPFDGKYYEEYKNEILKVLKERNLNIPLVYNFPIGHNEPKTILPIGSLAKIDSIANKVYILDSGCID